MYTFNLGLVVGNGSVVCIIVCNSESPIDQNAVQSVASAYLSEGMKTKQNYKEVVGMIIDGIKMECGVNAVLVNADVACVIPMK